MLQLSNAYLDHDVLSLRTGSVVGSVNEIIMNPNNLRIEGWRAQDIDRKGDFILPSSEVRDFIPKGIVVNDHDSITEKGDLVRLQSVIDIKFQLLGKPVATESKQRLGRIRDFAVDKDFYVQKLYVSPSFIKGIAKDQLIIDRTAIVEITDKKIIVQDQSVRVNSGQRAPAEA